MMVYGEALVAPLDPLGWCMIVFLGALFGIPYSRYFLRVRSIPKWPTVVATIVQASICQESPVGFVPGTAVLSNCSADYEYQVDGVLFKGRFRLMTGDDVVAAAVASQILQSKILVRYNPKRARDSVPVAEEILGRRVSLKQSWLNPNVW